jgi:hypothetical protein
MGDIDEGPVEMKDPWSAVIASAIRNTPLAVLAIGIIAFVIAAASGVPYFQIQIGEFGWRLALAILGVLIAAGGGLLFWRSPSKIETVDNAALKVRIRNPTTGDFVKSRFDVSGTYEKKPPNGIAIEIFELDESRNSYRPRRRANINNDGTWRAVNVWGGEKAGESRFYIAALTGQGGQILADYYRKVGDRYKDTGKSRPDIAHLPPDVLECDRIRVTTK